MKIKLESAQLYCNIAVSYHNLEKYDDAIVFYKKSLKLDGEYIHAYYNLGILYFYNKNELQKAKSFFEKVIEINPEHKTALNLWQIINQKLKEVNILNQQKRYLRF